MKPFILPACSLPPDQSLSPHCLGRFQPLSPIRKSILLHFLLLVLSFLCIPGLSRSGTGPMKHDAGLTTGFSSWVQQHTLHSGPCQDSTSSLLNHRNGVKGNFTGTPSGIKGPIHVVGNQQSMHGKGGVAGGHAYRRKERRSKSNSSTTQKGMWIPLRKYGLRAGRGPVSMQIWGSLQILGPVGIFSLQTAMLPRPGRTMLTERKNHPGCGWRAFLPKSAASRWADFSFISSRGLGVYIASFQSAKHIWE